MTVHVVSAAVWVGGAVGLLIVALLTARADNDEALGNLMRQMTKIGERVFTPAALLALASGVALVEKEDIGYGVFWIDFSLVVWALSFVTGAAFIGPTSKQLTRLIPERGLADSEIARKLKLLLTVARFDTALLLLVLVAMVVKPAF
jgi:uncharacterized membrane protein